MHFARPGLCSLHSGNKWGHVMEWRGRRGSRNIEDRRQSSGGRLGGIGGVGAIAVLLIGYFLGVDVTPLLEGADSRGGTSAELTEADRAAGEFVSVTLADTEDARRKRLLWRATHRGIKEMDLIFGSFCY